MNKILTAQQMTNNGYIPTPVWDWDGSITLKGPETMQFGTLSFKLARELSHGDVVTYVLRIPHCTTVAVFEIAGDRLEPVGRVDVSEEEYTLLANRDVGPALLRKIKELCAS